MTGGGQTRIAPLETSAQRVRSATRSSVTDGPFADQAVKYTETKVRAAVEEA